MSSPIQIDLKRLRRVLCLGAHSDDIEIGCGGTLLRLLESSGDLEIHWHVFAAHGPRQGEAQASAEHFLRGAATHTIALDQFRESYFPEEWAGIKDVFERIKHEFNPDLILTHWRDDRHQDHRVLSDLTWNTFRGHTVLEYEIPKYDGDMGRPNTYVSLDEPIARRKVDALMRHFATQRSRNWFTEDTFFGLMRLRGIECGPHAHYAEAFYSRKLVL